MKEEDKFQEILRRGSSIETSPDLEDIIMQKIEVQAAMAEKVKLYKRFGKISFLISLVLLACYIWQLAGIQSYSLFAKLPTQLTFTGLGLLLIFLELEIGVKKLSFFKR